MKKLALVFFFFVIASLASAQPKTYMLKRDTINIRGYVFNSNGKPAFGETVFSNQRDLVHNYSQLGSRVDSTGFFAIKGIAFNDTLTITNGIEQIKYQNHGSRYLVAYLPVPTTSELVNKGNLLITAHRLSAKKTPSFKIVQPDDMIICGWENSPEYVGGVDKLIKLIKLNLRYPAKAIINNIEGDVKIRFTVEKDGSVVNYRVVQGIGYGCDEAVIAVLKTGKKWKPGQANGHALTYDYTVTIPFRLTDE